MSRVEILREQTESWGDAYVPSDDVVIAWARYADLAKEWGTKMDLTAPGTMREQHELLFLDAFMMLGGGFMPERASLVDVGAGVGAPTIPLIMALHDLNATLVEPRRKRVAFMRYAIGACQLQQRAQVIENRVAAEAPTVEGMPFDVALSRATFPPPQWLQVGAALSNSVIAMLGRTDPPEHPRLKRDHRTDYVVPSTGSPRSLLRYRSSGMI